MEDIHHALRRPSFGFSCPARIMRQTVPTGGLYRKRTWTMDFDGMTADDMREFVAKGGDLDAREDGLTALHRAVMAEHRIL